MYLYVQRGRLQWKREEHVRQTTQPHSQQNEGRSWVRRINSNWCHFNESSQIESSGATSCWQHWNSSVFNRAPSATVMILMKTRTHKKRNVGKYFACVKSSVHRKLCFFCLFFTWAFYVNMLWHTCKFVFFSSCNNTIEEEKKIHAINIHQTKSKKKSFSWSKHIME